MNTLTAILYMIVGGIVNGSFALFTKFTPKWRIENLWAIYALWTYVILPWGLIFYLAPSVLTVYQAAPYHLLGVMAAGGLLFGIGQIGFVISIKEIGIGLSFLVNTGLGMALGFLLPLVGQHPDRFVEPIGIVTLLGAAIILISLAISYQAGRMRDLDRGKSKKLKPDVFRRGMLLALFAGVCSGIVNFSFSLTASIRDLAVSHGLSTVASAIIMWPVFLSFTLIPYITYMLYQLQKTKSWNLYIQKSALKYQGYAFLMSIFWLGSVICYSIASHSMGPLGPIVGWPLFMSLIILTSSFWGFASGEWRGSSACTLKKVRLSIFILVLAVIVLAFAAHLR